MNGDTLRLVSDAVYKPKVWKVLQFNQGNKSINKVLAVWEDGWKLSSGITEVVDKDSYYEIHNKSGSIYECDKQDERINYAVSKVIDELIGKIYGAGNISLISLEKKCRWENV